MSTENTTQSLVYFTDICQEKNYIHTNNIKLIEDENRTRAPIEFQPLQCLSRVYNEPIQRPAPSWLVSSIGKSAAPESQTSRVRRIQYKLQFFSSFLFATAKVVQWDKKDVYEGRKSVSKKSVLQVQLSRPIGTLPGLIVSM